MIERLPQPQDQPRPLPDDIRVFQLTVETSFNRLNEMRRLIIEFRGRIPLVVLQASHNLAPTHVARQLIVNEALAQGITMERLREL